MAKQKVLFLGKLPPPYIGPAVACEIILNSKLKEKYQLIHLDTSDHRDINTLNRIDFMNVFLALKQYAQMIRLLIRHRPNLVYIPAGQTNIGYLRDSGYILLAKIFGRKVLTHLRGGYFKHWYDESGSLLKSYIRFVHKKVDGQIVLGNNLRYLFNWLIPDEKIYVVPNGGNFPGGDHITRHDTITVLFLGNYIKSKGVLEALYSSAITCKQNSRIRYSFAGEWRDAEAENLFKEFMAAHPELPITNHGPVKGDAKFNLLRDSDIFVFPTYYRNEGHPWVIVEAMAAGLPVISTNHAAISESVIDGENGFLVEKKNTEQLADRILKLASDADLRRTMGDKSRQLYLENFTEEKMAERMGNVFEKVIAL